MMATCAAPRCTLRCTPLAAARSGAAVAAAAPRRLVLAAASNNQQQQPAGTEQQQPPAPPTTAADQKDFWEGEQWELLGNISSFFIPIVAALAVGVGLFASQTYNEGATVFLDAPKSSEDSARLIPAQQLQQAP